MQSVAITTKVVSSNPTHPDVVYSIQHYVIKFVSDLRQVITAVKHHTPDTNTKGSLRELSM